MPVLQLNTYLERVRLIGAIALVISIVAWWTDLSGLVYECPYCRVQRSVIGILGISLMLPTPGHWLVRFFAATIGFLGAHVAAAQNFMGWRRISVGEYSFHERFYIDPFLLSGCALFIIIGLAWLHFLVAPKLEAEEDAESVI